MFKANKLKRDIKKYVVVYIYSAGSVTECIRLPWKFSDFCRMNAFCSSVVCSLSVYIYIHKYISIMYKYIVIIQIYYAYKDPLNNNSSTHPFVNHISIRRGLYVTTLICIRPTQVKVMDRLTFPYKIFLPSSYFFVLQMCLNFSLYVATTTPIYTIMPNVRVFLSDFPLSEPKWELDWRQHNVQLYFTDFLYIFFYIILINMTTAKPMFFFVQLQMFNKFLINVIWYTI